MSGGERLQQYQRTPELAALFHQIRYDVNNKGISEENMNTYSYLRVFSHMGEEYADLTTARRQGMPISLEKVMKLRNFGKDGFAIVMGVAKEVAGLQEEEPDIPREEQRLGIYRFTSLTPFIESLEASNPTQPTEEDKKELQVYLKSLSTAISHEPLFAPKENNGAK